MTHNKTATLMVEFRAPSWATDWCARCEWAQTCTDCRAAWIG